MFLVSKVITSKVKLLLLKSLLLTPVYEIFERKFLVLILLLVYGFTLRLKFFSHQTLLLIRLFFQKREIVVVFWFLIHVYDQVYLLLRLLLLCHFLCLHFVVVAPCRYFFQVTVRKVNVSLLRYGFYQLFLL